MGMAIAELPPIGAPIQQRTTMGDVNREGPFPPRVQHHEDVLQHILPEKQRHPPTYANILSHIFPEHQQILLEAPLGNDFAIPNREGGPAEVDLAGPSIPWVVRYP